MFKTIKTHRFEWVGEGWVIRDIQRQIEREQRPTLFVTTADGTVTEWRVEDAPRPEGESASALGLVVSFWNTVLQTVRTLDPELF